MDTPNLAEIVTLLQTQNQLLEGILVVASLSLGSLLFVHFGLFMRW